MIAVQKQIPDSLQHRCVIATWASMPNGETGEAIELANFADRSVQIAGTFGVGGMVRIEGSIDGVNYAPLTDPQGNDLNIGTPKIEAITELVRFVRPRVVAGDGTTLVNVVMLMKGE